MTPFSGLLGDDLDTESAAETTGPGKPRKNAIDALFETAETPQQPAPRRNAIDALFENPKAPVPAPAAKPDALGSMRSRTPHAGDPSLASLLDDNRAQRDNARIADTQRVFGSMPGVATDQPPAGTSTAAVRVAAAFEGKHGQKPLQVAQDDAGGIVTMGQPEGMGVPAETITRARAGEFGPKKAIEAGLSLARADDGGPETKSILKSASHKIVTANPPGLASTVVNATLSGMADPLNGRAAEVGGEGAAERYAEGGGDLGKSLLPFNVPQPYTDPNARDLSVNLPVIGQVGPGKLRFRQEPVTPASLIGAGAMTGDLASQAAFGLGGDVKNAATKEISDAMATRLADGVAETTAQLKSAIAKAPRVNIGAPAEVNDLVQASHIRQVKILHDKLEALTGQLAERTGAKGAGTTFRQGADAAIQDATKAVNVAPTSTAGVVARQLARNAGEGAAQAGVTMAGLGGIGDATFGPEDGDNSVAGFAKRTAGRALGGAALGALLHGALSTLGEARTYIGAKDAATGELTRTQGSADFVRSGDSPLTDARGLLGPKDATADALTHGRPLADYLRSERLTRTARSPVTGENPGPMDLVNTKPYVRPASPPAPVRPVAPIAKPAPSLIETMKQAVDHAHDIADEKAPGTTSAEQAPEAPAPRQLVPTGGTPDEMLTRNIARGLKTSHPDAIAHAAPEMAQRVPPGAVLVPLPDHAGDTSANAALADAIAQHHGDADVADVLGHDGGASVPQDRPVVFVDGVERSPAATDGARRALGRPDAQVVAFAQAPEETPPVAATEPVPQNTVPEQIPSRVPDAGTDTPPSLIEQVRQAVQAKAEPGRIDRPDAPMVKGRDTLIRLGSGEKLEGHYAWMPEAAVIGSHDPVTFKPNPELPSGIQNRPYHGPAGKAAREQIQLQQANPDLDALYDTGTSVESGPTVVTPQGVGVAGFGRDMTERGVPAAKRPAMLAARQKAAIAAGIPADAIQANPAGRLVRVLSDPSVDVRDPKVLGALNIGSDRPAMKSKSAAAEGASRATALMQAPDALAHFSSTVDPEATLSEYLGSKDGTAFVRSLVHDGVIGVQEVGRFIDPRSGTVTADGSDVIKHMMYAAAVPNADVLDQAPKVIKQKLEHSIPAIVTANLTPNYELGPVLEGALALLHTAKATAGSLEAYLAQSSLIAGDEHPDVVHMARFLDGTPRAKATAAFRQYGTLAKEAAEQGQSHDMFGGTPETREQLMDRLFTAPTEKEKTVAVAEHAAGYGNEPVDSGQRERFYSRLERAIANAPFAKGTAEQWKAALSKNVAKGEREWTGVDKMLDENAGKVLTRQQVQDVFDTGKVELTETQYGGESRVSPERKTELDAAHDAAQTAHIEAGKGTRAASRDLHDAIDAGGAQGDSIVHHLVAKVAIDDVTPNDIAEVMRKRASYARQPTPDALARVVQAAHALRRTVLAERQTHRSVIDARRAIEESHTGPTTYEQYTEPGGTNYREIIVSLKHDLGFIDRHWIGVKNPVIHFRLNDRILPNEKVLHVEEVQSGLHQQGREKGYGDQKPWVVAKEGGEVLSRHATSEEADAEMARLEADGHTRLDSFMQRSTDTVPDAPLKKTEEWMGLAMKHIIDLAVKGGYDRVSWTTGAQQAARYDLSSQVDKLTYNPKTNELRAYKNGSGIHEGNYDPKALASVIGKEAAEKLLAARIERSGYEQTPSQTLEGKDLVFGGHGMKAFYDEMIPSYVKDYGKKMGVKLDIDPVQLPNGSESPDIGEYRVVDRLARRTDLPHGVQWALSAIRGKMDDGYSLTGATEYTIRKFNEEEEPEFTQDVEDHVHAVIKQGLADAAETQPSNQSFRVTPELRQHVEQHGQALWEKNTPYQARGAAEIQMDLFGPNAPKDAFRKSDPISTDKTLQQDLAARLASVESQIETYQATPLPGDAYQTTAHSLAVEVAQRMIREGNAASLVGMELHTEADLAAGTDVLRSPFTETFYLIPQTGVTVDAVSAISSRMAGSTAVFVDHNDLEGFARYAVDLMEQHGSDAISFLHNHPNGVPTASSPDIRATPKMVNAINAERARRGLPPATFRGHLIKNHRTYNVIRQRPSGAYETVAGELSGAKTADPFRKQGMAVGIGHAVLNDTSLLALAAQLEPAKTNATILWAGGERNAVSEIGALSVPWLGNRVGTDAGRREISQALFEHANTHNGAVKGFLLMPDTPAAHRILEILMRDGIVISGAFARQNADGTMTHLPAPTAWINQVAAGSSGRMQFGLTTAEQQDGRVRVSRIAEPTSPFRAGAVSSSNGTGQSEQTLLPPSAAAQSGRVPRMGSEQPHGNAAVRDLVDGGRRPGASDANAGAGGVAAGSGRFGQGRPQIAGGHDSPRDRAGRDDGSLRDDGRLDPSVREMAGGFGEDLFGGKSQDEEPQDSLFGDADGTDSKRSLAATESSARSEIGRLKQEQALADRAVIAADHPTLLAKHAKRQREIAMRLAVLEKLTNRDKAITADEMATRAKAGENDMFSLGEKVQAYHGKAAGYGAQETPQGAIDRIKAAHPDVQLDVFVSKLHPDTWQLAHIRVPKTDRNTGVGTNVMRELTQAADAHGARITLTPGLEGGKARLRAFYRDFGFKKNRSDFAISDSMIREPGATVVREPGADYGADDTAHDEVDQHIKQLRDSGDEKAAANLERFMDGSVIRDRLYRGDFRADKLGTVFKKGRATSGRFYFTDDPDVAGKYATGKQDLQHKGHEDYANWFKVKTGPGKRDVAPLNRAWYSLTKDQRTRLQDTLMRARADENTGKLTFDGPADGGIASLDHWKHVLGESRGDWLTAAKDVWLDSGALFDDEHQFGDILKHAGIDVEMDSPHESRPGTTPVFVSIRRPLIAEQVPADVVEAIQSLAKRDRSVARPGYDMWDKNSITLRDWIKDRFDGSLSHDEGTWATQVPEKVTKLLQAMGYDGIRHDGGVSTGGKHHHVWIAFEPNQIKSAVGNKGTFNPNTNNIIAEPGADYGEQHGMFGDEPADEPATGIKNAVSAETRESLGMGERVRPEPRTQKEMYDAGKATAASDPTAIPRLIAELRDNPEKIVGTETEAGLLLKHRVDLENKLLALVAARDEAIKGDDAPAEHLARLQLAEHREQIKEFVHLAERTGTAAGRALAARTMMSKLDYSLSHMETMAEAAKSSPLTHAELAWFKAFHDEVVIKLAAAEKDAAASNERAAEAEADLHHAQLRATAMQPVMDRVSTKLGSAADAAKARIRARGMRAMAGMDPVDLADHAIIGADALAKGLIRFAEWSHAMKETFGTEIAPHLREIFDASNETLNKELKQARALEPRTTTKPGAQKGPAVPPVSIRARLQARLDGGTSLSDLRPYLRQLALEHIRKGIIGREALLDALHTDVLETGASVTRAQTRDALSGYGVFRPLDKAADKAKLRDIQAEAQKLAQLEALQKGKAPLATGFERQGPNDETRKLTKQVNEAKKAAGIAQIDDASRLKSALGAAKTRIRNAIADLRTEIDTGERMVRGKSVLISDTELDTLRGELAELRKQETEVFGDKTLTDEQRLQRATATAKRTADLWETRVEKARNGAFDATGRRPVMSAPELNALRAKADKARAEYAELRSLDPAQQQLDDQKANARYRANIEKRKAEILDRLARADYTPRAHPPGTKFDRQSIVAKTDLEEVKQRYQDALRKFEKANRTGLEKARDRVVAFTRASVLSSPTVIVKLTAVALSRVVTTPLTDLVALGVSNALPRLAKGAARYGTRSPMVALRAEAAAQTAMWTDGMIDAARQLKNKQSRLTLLHGKHKLPHEWYEYAGSIHAALKEPVKRAEYARALYRLTADAMERGENTTDDFVKLRLSTEAYLHADGAVAMNDNIVTDAWKAGLHRLDRVDPKTGKKPLAGLMLAGALKTDMPIMKAPTNVVIEASEFIAGLPLGAAKAAWSYYHGIEDLKPVERDSIIRLISKGAVGLAIMALVFYKYKDIEFGGYYQRGEHRGPDEVPADAGRIGTTIVSKNLLHNPIFFPAQFAATTARLANTRLHRNDDDPIGYQSALLAAAVGFAEQVPIAGSLVNDLHTALDPKQNAGFLEKKAASILVPSLIQWIAKKTDPDGDLPRKPVGMKQHVMVNVPGLRSRVPIDDKKVQRLQRLSQR